MNVIKILFVCYGNICRSPMAEFVLKDMIQKKNRQAEFEIASAAVSDDALGCDMHRGSRQKLTEEGIPFSSRQARRMCPEDYHRYDWIVAMDRSNIADIERITRGDPENKVRLLLDFAGEHRDIADPWYTRDFDATYKDITKGCQALLNQL